jgi:predicted dehydrogenase
VAGDRIKVGVVGVGYLGRIHAQKYAHLPDADLVGVVDLDEGCCHEVATNTNCRPFADYHDLAGEVEAVSIAVPTLAHYPIAKAFLQAGIDVLLEKPITATVQEAAELNAVAQAEGAIFQVGHLERFNGALKAVPGVLEDPLWLESFRLAPFSGRGSDVDVILDLMIHDLDIILNLLDDEVVGVEGVGIPVCTPHIDIAHARLVFKGGCTANITASRVAHERVRRMTILQKKSYLTVDYLKQSLTVTRGKERGDERIQVDEVVNVGDALERQLTAFLRSVRTRTRPVVSGEDGQRALELAFRIADVIKRGSR